MIFSGKLLWKKKPGCLSAARKPGNCMGLEYTISKDDMGDIDIVVSDTGGRKKFRLTVMMNGKPAAAS